MDCIWEDVFSVSFDCDTASRYVNGLLDKMADKSNFPKSGTPLYRDNGFTGYYFVCFKSYMAFYRLEGAFILVDRVLYGKSDYVQNLFSGGKIQK